MPSYYLSATRFATLNFWQGRPERAYLSIAEIYAQNQQFEMAKKFLSMALSLKPSDTTATALTARVDAALRGAAQLQDEEDGEVSPSPAWEPPPPPARRASPCDGEGPVVSQCDAVGADVPESAPDFKPANPSVASMGEAGQPFHPIMCSLIIFSGMPGAGKGLCVCAVMRAGTNAELYDWLRSQRCSAVSRVLLADLRPPDGLLRSTLHRMLEPFKNTELLTRDEIEVRVSGFPASLCPPRQTLLLLSTPSRPLHISQAADPVPESPAAEWSSCAFYRLEFHDSRNSDERCPVGFTTWKRSRGPGWFTTQLARFGASSTSLPNYATP